MVPVVSIRSALMVIYCAPRLRNDDGSVVVDRGKMMLSSIKYIGKKKKGRGPHNQLSPGKLLVTNAWRLAGRYSRLRARTEL